MLIQESKYSIYQTGEIAVIATNQGLPANLDVIELRKLSNNIIMILKAAEQSIRDSQKIGADYVESKIS